MTTFDGRCGFSEQDDHQLGEVDGETVAGDRQRYEARHTQLCVVAMADPLILLASSLRRIGRGRPSLSSELAVAILAHTPPFDQWVAFVPAVCPNHESIRDSANGTGVGPDQ